MKRLVEAGSTGTYLLVGRLKNNRLWRAIIEMWPEVKTQKEAAVKLDITQSYLGGLLNMKYCPSRRASGWSKGTTRLAEKLAHTPDYLFDPVLYGKRPPVVEVAFTPSNLLGYDRVEPKQIEGLVHRDQQDAVNNALRCLRPSEEYVLKKRFGLDGEGECTLEEVGQTMAITRERVRTIEAHAIRRLRHPNQSRELRKVLPD